MSNSKQNPSAVTFEDLLADLELSVRQLEEGKLGLSESLEVYQRGVERLRKCHDLLREAERKIELLTGVDAEGNPVVAPFAEQEMSIEEKQASRSRRRTHKPESSPADAEIDEQRGLF